MTTILSVCGIAAIIAFTTLFIFLCFYVAYMCLSL
jgi:hypothetical protein